MMKNQKGGAAVVVLGIIAVVFISLIVVAIGSYITYANKANVAEKQMIAEWDKGKAILANHWQKVQEVAQVPEMYAADFKAIVQADVQGRYGSDGSRATMQWIKERNLNFDADVYKEITRIIVAGRDEFKNQQARNADVKRVYTTMLDNVWGGFWMRLAGYPKVNLDDFKIVTTEGVEQSFKTGKEASPVKLRPVAAPAK
jgi:hypothetical protein